MKDIEFTELLKVSHHLCKFSKNGQFLAVAFANRCFVRDAQNLQTLQIFSCIDNIEAIEWSDDSCYLLCTTFRRSTVQVWSLEEPDWTCKIEEGTLGLTHVCWSPDGRHILTTAKFHLRITVWSLVTKAVSYLKYAKPANPGLAFRSDGKYLALAERRECRDHISIIVCSTWQLVKHFETETRDLGGISWSPDGMLLCIWESLAEDYNIHTYTLDGNCLSSYNAYRWALGIKSVTWSPTGQFLAVGSYDQKVRVLSRITLKPVAEFGFSANISNNMVVYQEKLSSPGLSFDCSLVSAHCKYEIVNERPVFVNGNSLDYTKPNPKHGVGSLIFSSDSRFLASINDNMPTAVWIWDIEKLEMAVVLIHINPIKCLEWDPVRTRLALCTETSNVFLWSPSGCLAVEVPEHVNLKIQTLKWHPAGDRLLLTTKDSMCMCFLSS